MTPIAGTKRTLRYI